MESFPKDVDGRGGGVSGPEASLPGGGLRTRRLRIPDELGVAVSLAVMIVVIGLFRPAFVDTQNLINLVSGSAFYGMIALAMVYLLALGEIDLSVGWNFNFSAVVAGKLMIEGLNPWLAALAGVAFGAGLGLVNGLLSIGLRLPVIIITLGTFSMFQGLAQVVNDSSSVVPPDTEGSFFRFAGWEVADIPLAAIVFVLLAVLLHVVLHRTRFGYRVQAIGANPEAARLAGIPLARTRLLALVLVGAVCGLSAVLFLGVRQAIDPSSGSAFMLLVIAAAIIGGTPIAGGSGTVVGAVFGVLIIAAISTGIIFFGIDATWSTFVTGAVIVLAVGIDQGVRWLRRRQDDARAARLLGSG